MRARHPVIPVVYDGLAECSVCGGGVDFNAFPIRHVGETAPVVVPEPEDARAFARAVDLAEAALAAMPGDASPADYARAIVERIYEAGLVRRRATPPRSRDVPDVDPVDAARAVRARYEVPERPLARVG